MKKKKFQIDIKTISLSKGELKWHNQKEDGQKQEHIQKDLHGKKEQPTFVTCPNCNEPVLPHRVCSNCGYYDGKQVVAKKKLKMHSY